MAKIYRVKEDYDVKTFEELNYVIFPEQLKAAKVVIQPLNGKAVQSLLERYYANNEWIEKIYNKFPDYFVKELGLTYNKNGKPKMTKKFKTMLMSWVIEVELNEDRWVGFTSIDKYDGTIFYNCNVLDNFCGEEIELLKKHNLIEVIEVKD